MKRTALIPSNGLAVILSVLLNGWFLFSGSHAIAAEDFKYDTRLNLGRTIPASSLCEMSSFSFLGLAYPVNGVINQAAQTINVIVPYGTVTSSPMIATFVSSPLSVVSVSGTVQQSGVTANTFEVDRTYRVTAEDAVTFKDYVVHVSIALPAVGNTILTFSFLALEPVVSVLLMIRIKQST
jgi:hypothetical protein